MKVLAGDIGGTNTRLLYADVNGNDEHIIAERSFHSIEYTGLNELLNIFLSEHEINEPVDAACFAIAGPVKSGEAEVTNLPWVISEIELGHFLQIPKVRLINDFIAVVYGIERLDGNDIHTLQQGEVNNIKHPDGVVVGAGTGFGVAHRVWLNDHYQAFPSEAGHVGFSPENELQCALLAWLQKKHSHVSLEMLLSGKGLGTIYSYLSENKGISDSLDICNVKQEDQAQVITNCALSHDDELCQKTLDCFIDIYGAAAGNAALNYYPVDEVFIGGGIGPKIKEKLLNGRFIDAFVDKGAMSSNMEKITIKLILQDKTGLYGALSHAKML